MTSEIIINQQKKVGSIQLVGYIRVQVNYGRLQKIRLKEKKVKVVKNKTHYPALVLR